MKTGAELIAEERARQVSREGWTPEHDDEHPAGSLEIAGRCYAKHAHGQLLGFIAPHGTPMLWPWDSQWWKPSDDPVRNLVKAGALIAAEIDRLQRKSAREER
jgi:hypothetical protein